MKIRYIGTFAVNIPALSLTVKQGQEFEVQNEDIAKDLIRRDQYFVPVVEVLPMPEETEEVVREVRPIRKPIR